MKKAILFLVIFALASASALAVVQSHPADQLTWVGGAQGIFSGGAYVLPSPVLFIGSTFMNGDEVRFGVVGSTPKTDVYFADGTINVYGKPDSSDSVIAAPNAFGYQQGVTDTVIIIGDKLQFTDGILTKVDDASSYGIDPCISADCSAKCVCPSNSAMSCIFYPSGTCVPLKNSKSGIYAEGVNYYCDRGPLTAACSYGCYNNLRCRTLAECGCAEKVCDPAPNNCANGGTEYKVLTGITNRGACLYNAGACCVPTASCRTSPLPSGCYWSGVCRNSSPMATC